MGRYDVMAPDSLALGTQQMARSFEKGVQTATQKRGQNIQLANMALGYQQSQNKLAAAKQQLGVKQAKDKLTSEYKTRMFQVQDRIYANEIGESKYHYDKAATELQRRDALKTERLLRLKEAWNRGSKGPVLRGIQNNRPVFERDLQGNVLMMDRDEYAAHISRAGTDETPGYVDLIDVPGMVGDEIIGFKEDPEATEFQNSADLKRQLGKRSKEIEMSSLDRQKIRFAEASRLGLADPQDIGMFNNSLKKNPTIEDFLKLPERLNFDGMSDNQKNSILKSIDDMGGIENAIRTAAAFNKIDHAKWLAQWWKTVRSNPNISFNFSQIDDAYYRDANKAMRERGFKKMGRQAGINRTRLQKSVDNIVQDGSFQPSSEGQVMGEGAPWSEMNVPRTESRPFNMTEKQFRASKKRRMSKKKYEDWEFGRDVGQQPLIQPSRSVNQDVTTDGAFR